MMRDRLVTGRASHERPRRGARAVDGSTVRERKTHTHERSGKTGGNKGDGRKSGLIGKVVAARHERRARVRTPGSE